MASRTTRTLFIYARLFRQLGLARNNSPLLRGVFLDRQRDRLLVETKINFARHIFDGRRRGNPVMEIRTNF